MISDEQETWPTTPISRFETDADGIAHLSPGTCRASMNVFTEEVMDELGQDHRQVASPMRDQGRVITSGKDFSPAAPTSPCCKGDADDLFKRRRRPDPHKRQSFCSTPPAA
jgi:hypothetical protein